MKLTIVFNSPIMKNDSLTYEEDLEEDCWDNYYEWWKKYGVADKKLAQESVVRIERIGEDKPVKHKMSHTMWLYGQETLEVLKHLPQKESYDARVQLLKTHLGKITWEDSDYQRAKDINEAIEWWLERKAEVFGYES